MLLKFNLKTREKRAIIIGGILASFIISYSLFTWYSEMRLHMIELAEAKSLLLERQLDKISRSQNLNKEIEAVKVELKEIEKWLLSGDKPPVAAAELQRLLKEMGLSSGIEIKSERALSPVDNDIYRAIPVEVAFAASTAQLKEMLYMIETSPFLLTISDMKIRVINIHKPGDIYTTLTVKGFIKKGVRGQGSGVSKYKSNIKDRTGKKDTNAA